jgi:hypothetical protein
MKASPGREARRAGWKLALHFFRRQILLFPSLRIKFFQLFPQIRFRPLQQRLDGFGRKLHDFGNFLWHFENDLGALPGF